MKFIALLVASASAINIRQQPTSSYRLVKPAFTGDAANDFNVGVEPSCPSYLSGYSCKSWWEGKVTGLQGQSGGFRGHQTLHPTS